MNKLNMAYKIKTVSITDEQEKWLEENDISLSKLVQKAINERMKKKP